MEKLTQRQINDWYREELRKEQKGICPLCGKYIRRTQATLDHDHETGKCRRVLHRQCNRVEGVIAHWSRTLPTNRLTFLRRLIQYWETDYSDQPIHPTHGQPKRKKRKSRRTLR